MVKFVSDCATMRREEGGEALWHALIKNATRLSQENFLTHVAPALGELLEPDEPFEEFIASDPDTYFAVTSCAAATYYFFMTCGFEFFFLETP